MTTAVFLMALGGPDSLENVEPYLLDLRGGRPTSAELVEEIRERYRATGGRSPVLGITRELAAKLEARRPVRAIVGLRHWHPFIAEAWAEVVALAPERVLAICMAPQYSAMTVGKYLEKLADARTDVGGGDIPLSAVPSWATHPGLVAGLADRVDEADHASRAVDRRRTHRVPAMPRGIRRDTALDRMSRRDAG